MCSSLLKKKYKQDQLLSLLDRKIHIYKSVLQYSQKISGLCQRKALSWKEVLLHIKKKKLLLSCIDDVEKQIVSLCDWEEIMADTCIEKKTEELKQLIAQILAQDQQSRELLSLHFKSVFG